MAESLCEFCGVARAVMYCKSDAAGLCLQCDLVVHAANVISRRHLRSLICDKCFQQQAVVRCLDESLSFCQNCECCCFTAADDHRRAKILSYSGCPTDGDLANIWSWILDWNFSQPDFGMPSGSEAAAGNTLDEIASCLKFGAFAIPPLPTTTSFSTDNSNNDLPLFSQGSSFQKNNQNNPCDNGGLMEKNLSITGSNSTRLDTTLEASSSVQQDCIGFQPNLMPPGMPAAANCVAMDPSMGLRFANGPASSIALSNPTRESSAAEYQDCGISPLFMTGDSLWDSNFDPRSPQARDKAKMRYNEKKKTRMYVILSYPSFNLFTFCFQIPYNGDSYYMLSLVNMMLKVLTYYWNERTNGMMVQVYAAHFSTNLLEWPPHLKTYARRLVNTFDMLLVKQELIPEKESKVDL
ncbi:putative zinc finger protein CONSTANS-LIKE 11 isoform X2 [Andrographis paniculata]|uniref:putative zinc finger protein CONSTANS-LIKE 11 isoform X2 n=1 Tax=Andrographis paniculata TaxID=175694 RepID=UPI0021E6F0D8|nr:putative zinc finger protein CONSTANS-LIKE 11 isoform X2 [Andrographis paniculata]